VIILNKSDLSDPKANEEWTEYFKKDGNIVLQMNCMRGQGVPQLFKLLEKLQNEKNEGRAVKKPLRMMIVGVPNVGKSSLINRMTGKKSAKTGDRPGVTKGKQWLSLENGMQLLDTPGILWPKFDDQKVGLHIAMIGSINEDILDQNELAIKLLDYIMTNYKGYVQTRYNVEEEGNGEDMLKKIADKRACKKKGGELDLEKMSSFIVDDFRGGRIGKVTLERPEDFETTADK